MGTGQTVASDVRKKFREGGFEVIEAGDRAIAIKKNNCIYHLKRGSGGAWLPSGPPCFLMRGLECELEDRGYQKFWLHQGKRFPIRVTDLKTLHHFDQEVRLLLGLKSLFHESLGTTCARSAYDRLHGRPDN